MDRGLRVEIGEINKGPSFIGTPQLHTSLKFNSHSFSINHWRHHLDVNLEVEREREHHSKSAHNNGKPVSHCWSVVEDNKQICCCFY